MQNDQDSSESRGAMARGARQVLTFCLGAEVYGVDIRCVKEIRPWSKVTRIPQSPPYVLGVLNLRGVVVPIVDLRVRFALECARFDAVTVIIVLSLQTTHGQREVGIVVDCVQDVVDVDADTVKPPPFTTAGGINAFVEGIATHDERMLVLLNAANLASSDQSSTDVATAAA